MPRVPYDTEAERDCIGAMLQRPAAVDTVFDFCNATDFYEPRNRMIVEVIEQRWRNAESCSIIEIAADLEARNVANARRLLLTINGEALSIYEERAARRVGELAACRRLLALTDSLGDHARHGSMDRASALLNDWEATVSPPNSVVEPPRNIVDLVEDTTIIDHDWTIDRLLARRERLLITGGEGGGKSTLVRQLAVCAAAGIHPFHTYPMPQKRVLYIDLENDESESKREWARFRRYVGDHETDLGFDGSNLGLYIRPAGIDLTSTADERWMRGICANFRPDIVCLGPLYKAYAGAAGRRKDSEETAEQVTRCLDRIRVAHDCTLIMEGHSPHGDNGDRAGYRMRGSSLWLGWPQFVIGLARVPNSENGEVLLKRARGFRDRTRRWPHRLFEAPNQYTLPWIAPAEQRGAA